VCDNEIRSFSKSFAWLLWQIKAPDARVINLETAVTTSPDAWPDKGINYRMHPGGLRPHFVARFIRASDLHAAQLLSSAWQQRGSLTAAISRKTEELMLVSFAAAL
jgi:hypothetical protein